MKLELEHNLFNKLGMIQEVRKRTRLLEYKYNSPLGVVDTTLELIIENNS